MFEPAPDDGRIGEVEAGPVIVARPGKPKIVVLGFHPALSAMRYELADAAAVRQPAALDVAGDLPPLGNQRGQRGSGQAGDGPGHAPAIEVKVTAEDGSPLPFTMRDRTLDFFAGTPGSVRVVAGDREYLYSLTLPELWDSKWEPPAEARKGIPRFTARCSTARPICGRGWRCWAALGLLAEWMLYGRFRRGRLRLRTDAAAPESHRSRGGAPMTFDHPLGLLLVFCCPCVGRRGSGDPPRAAWRCCSKAAAFAGHRAGASGAAHHVSTRPRSRWRCWRTRRPASRRRICRRESAFADQRGARPRTPLDARDSVRPRHAHRGAPTSDSKSGWQLRHTAGAAGHGTNLEAAIRDGAAALPAGMVPRLLLISDGNENLGSVARAIWQAQQLGHSHRYRAARRTSQARACCWNRSAFPGRSSAASAFPSM